MRSASINSEGISMTESMRKFVAYGCGILIALASAASAQTPERRPSVEPSGSESSQSAPRARTDQDARDQRANPEPAKRPFFSFKRYAPDEEPWNPSWQMDPRIGRHQRYSAPN